MSALDEFMALKDKRFIDRTNIENVIVLLWQEINGYESICIRAAGELAALKLEAQHDQPETDEGTV